MLLVGLAALALAGALAAENLFRPSPCQNGCCCGGCCCMGCCMGCWCWYCAGWGRPAVTMTVGCVLHILLARFTQSSLMMAVSDSTGSYVAALIALAATKNFSKFASMYAR